MSMWDSDEGYDRDDPKHPGFVEAFLDAADMARKRDREQPVTCAYEDVDESGGVKGA